MRSLVRVAGGVAGIALAWAVVLTTAARAEDAPASPPGAPAPAQAPKDHPCLSCHGDRTKAPKHQVDWDRYSRSVHGENDCDMCHEGYTETPHKKDAAKTTPCQDCHDDPAKSIAQGVHGRSGGEGAAGIPAAGCADCHGTHDVFKPGTRESKLHPLNVSATCLACHGPDPAKHSRNPRLVPKKVDPSHDIHMDALTRSGLTVAPNCVTCHGKHDIIEVTDPKSPVHSTRAAETCGTCHLGIVERYRESVHGKTPRDAAKTANHKEPATCYDCHKPHQVQQVEGAWKVEVIETCGTCHSDYLRTYRGTYHGRVTDMGFRDVASCDACHTAHSIQRSSDPRSSVHPGENRLATCKTCHGDATPRFTAYPVHADPTDPVRWPVLFWADRIFSSMILAVWCLAGIHILLWFIRAMIDRKHILEHRAMTSRRWYERLRPAHRVLHMILVLSFLTLALTGLPLRFHQSAWSPIIYSLFGGPDSVRFLHRAAGVVTFGYFFFFVGHLVWRVRRGEKEVFRPWNSMLPRWKDVQDIKDNFRWFVKGGKPPRFDRWTYWEKFDFWAEVWGVGFIGLTGLVMWFPVEATSVMPGWIVNLAHMLHSYEALLATSFIFTVHFFHANLRPGKFPLDPVFLTGRIPEHELALERPEEYARMKADGRLDALALPPPDPSLVRRAYILGGTLLTIGLLLLALMVSSLLGV